MQNKNEIATKFVCGCLFNINLSFKLQTLITKFDTKKLYYFPLYL